MGKRLDTTEFIRRATQRYGNKYSYENSVYTTYKQKVDIECQIHGIFKQTPSDHLSGYGCMECGGKKALTTAAFVTQASIQHNNKYDYTLVDYSTSHGMVTIICPRHGEFTQKAYSHIQGHGCPSCSTSNPIDTEAFISRAVSKHGSQYDYSNVHYVNNRTKIEIICPNHGSFFQTPNNHLTGNGCNACGYIESSNANRSSTDEFISKAIQVHGDVYDYSNVEYIATHTLVEILCRKHGSFTQKPNTHLNGHGCHRCNNIGGYNYNKLTTDPELVGVDGWLYLMKLCNADENFHKVGITRHIESRMTNMVSGYDKILVRSVPLKLLHAFILEQNILRTHTTFTPQKLFAGHTECLNLSDQEEQNLLDMLDVVSDDMVFTLLES